MVHMRKIKRWLPLFLFLVVINYGCVKSQVLPGDVPIKVIYTQAWDTIKEKEILKAVAQIDLVTVHGHHKAKAVLVLKRPSYLRLEILSPLGLPDYFLVTNISEIRIFIPSKNLYYQGKATAENLSRFLPWSFGIEDIVMILSGAFPPMTGSNVSFKGQKEAARFFIEAEAPGREPQIVEIEENNRLLKFMQKDRYGKEAYHVKYQEYDKESRIPKNIAISMADGITSMHIKYYDLVIEESNDLSVFDLPLPEGLKPVFLD